MPETTSAPGVTQEVMGQAMGEMINPTMRALFVGRDLNLQSTADQQLEKMFSGTRYAVTKIVGVRKAGAATALTAGGIFTGAGKSGSAIVSALQGWGGLSGLNKLVDVTLGALLGTDVQTSSTLYLSLAIGSLATATADVFVFGVIVD